LCDFKKTRIDCADSAIPFKEDDQQDDQQDDQKDEQIEVENDEHMKKVWRDQQIHASIINDDCQ